MSFIFTVILLSVTLVSFSQTQLKVGHVNINEILTSLPASDSAKAILDKETKDLQTTYGEMRAVYDKLYDDYQKGLQGYSELVKKSKEDELLDKQKRLGEFEQNATATIERRNTELVQPIYNKIIKAIEKVATSNGFTYILDVSKGSVVFTSKESQNINDQVLKILKP